MGDVEWENVTASLKFRLEDPNAKGFYLSLRTLNSADPEAPGGTTLPQATNINGIYLIFEMDGTWRLAPSTRDRWNVTTAGGPMLPLILHKWYNVSASVIGEQLNFLLQPSIADEAAKISRTLKLAKDVFPDRGQLGIGLIDYGLASIDDLNVKGDR